ncbi:Transposase and inactivated derivatives [Raoultella planticola]|uniref:Transposase and inactivated derivatives n=1 Tax=Raoultella planticola TaxID=575 RepID=A0A485A772_RAOPL|nr:Transposase and inactivated derivatives [Raoultella planticola]
MKNMTLALGLLISSFAATAADMTKGADNFYKSDKVIQQKVTFKNQYQMNVVGNLFIPQTLNQNAKNPAIVVGHPMGAVKEQSANLYAQKLADQGFVTLGD